MTKDIEERREQEAELEWKIASYRVFLKQLEYEEAKLKAEERHREYQGAEERSSQLETRANQLHALYHYSRLLKAEGELAEYNARLEALDVAEPELLEQLAHAKAEMAWAWQTENHKLTNQIEAVQGQVLEVEELLKQITRTKEDQQSQLVDLHLNRAA